MIILGNIIVAVLLFCYALQDIRSRSVYWPAAVPAGLAGPLLRMAFGLPPSQSLPGLLPGLFLLILSWLRPGAVGRGDGCALLACGAVLGFARTFEMLVIALVFAVIWSLCLLAVKRDMKQSFAFMPFLFAAHLCVMAGA